MSKAEKMIIVLLVHCLRMLVGMRWEKNGGDFPIQESAIRKAENMIQESEAAER